MWYIWPAAPERYGSLALQSHRGGWSSAFYHSSCWGEASFLPCSSTSPPREGTGKEPGASAASPCCLCCSACSLGKCVRKGGREHCNLALSATGITFQKQHWKKKNNSEVLKKSWHQNQEQVECWCFTTWFNYYFLPARSCWSAVSLHDKT